VIDELGVKSKILQDNESEVIEFVTNEKGVFEYYCSVGQHRQMGMVGNLIVE
jgi:plastocyanin